MKFTKKQRISALAATAALVAAGVTAGTANAGSASGGSPSAKGALPAPLTATAHGKLVKAADTAAAKTADAKALGLGSKEKLHVKDVIKNQDGSTHVRYERTYDGLPVLGGDMVVHKAKSGKRTGVSRASAPEKLTVSTEGVTSSAKPATPKAAGSKAPRKVVWVGHGKPVVAWETVHGGTQESGAPNRMHVVTDASTGKKLASYQGVQTAEEGTGKSQYSGDVKLSTGGSDGKYTLTDKSRGSNKTLDLKGSQSGDGEAFTDKDNKWGTGKPADAQTAAVDAHYGSAQTWDFYKDVFKREGIAGDGKGAASRVHYGKNYANAFWDDSCFCMTYGDGKDNKKPLTSVDVTAHEMSHGVTSSTAGLEYMGESGGLNEATSDIMAAAVEFHVDSKKDVADYLVGEQINLEGDGKPLRYMDKPSRDGNSLDNWSKDAGDQDVHYSSGIANHFFYLLSEGSGKKEVKGVKYDSPTADDSEVKGIGIKKAQAIWFKALTENFTSTTDYADARKQTVKAADDLYGKGGAESKAVESAWAGVNVK